MIEIRKTIILRETVFSELGVEAPRPITRAVGMAVILNPFAGQFVEDLRPLFEAGAMLGERLMPELVQLLDRPAVSYGKGAIVGVAGEMEHDGACVHPMLEKPMRAAIGGGKAVIGSNVKLAAAGAVLDVPLGSKDDSWSLPHFDTITVSVADAPRPDETCRCQRGAPTRPISDRSTICVCIPRPGSFSGWCITTMRRAMRRGSPQRGGTRASTGLPPNAAWRAATLRGCRHCWPRTSRPHGRSLRRSAGEA